jgi:WD40 repeat protein
MSVSPESRAYGRFDELAEEFAERYRRGERPSIEEYVARLPAMADEIREMFPALVEVERAEAGAREDEPLSPTPVPHQTQVGDYRFVRTIGRGGMGVVYEAEQVSLGRRVALKVLLSHVLGDRQAHERFRREAKAAARLHHTNIVPVFEVGQEGDVAFYAMQLIRGHGLDQVIHELRQLRESDRQVARKDARGPAEPVAAPLVPGTARASARKRQLREVANAILTGPLASDGLDSPTYDPSAATEGLDADALSGSVPASPGVDHREASPAHDISTSAVQTLITEGEPSGNRQPFFRSVAQIGRQAAQGLAYAHSRGIVHRDIKPSNLLLDTAGIVWITDFGLAKTDEEGLTVTGDVLGTLRYIAPERFRGEADARSDIYSLGLTLYELVTLEPAYAGSDRLKLAELIKTEEPARPRSLNNRIPRDLETIVLKAIDKEPARRYATAGAMAEDLRRFLADEPIMARRVSAAERYWRWARRNPGIAVLGSTLLGVLILVTIGSMVAAQRFRVQARANETLAAKEAAARQTTDQANASLRVKEEELRRTVYATRSNLALAAWDAGDLGRLRFLVDAMLPGEGDPDIRGWEWHYLNRLARQEQLTFHGHDREVTQALFSPDGRMVASVQWGNGLVLWNPADGHVLRTLLAPDPAIKGPLDRGVSGLAFSRDGKRLAGPGPDATLGIWNTQTGALTLKFKASGGGTLSVAFSPDCRKLVTGSASQKIRVWDASNGRQLYVLEHAHEQAVHRVVFSRDGERMASAGGGSIKFWDVASGRLLATEPFPGVMVSALAYSPDGQTLVSGGSDRTVKIRDPGTGHERGQFVVQSSTIGDLAYSPDSRRLATGGSDAVVRLWDIATSRQLRAFKGHTDRVASVAFSPDGKTVASTSFDKTVRLWDTSRPAEPLMLTSGLLVNFQIAPACVAFSPDGQLVASGHRDRTVRVWETDTGRLRWTMNGHANTPNAVAFSPDGKTIASAGEDKTARIWDIATGKERSVFAQNQAPVRCVRFSPDGGRLLTVGDDHILKVWEVATSQTVMSIPKPTSEIHCADFSPDARTLAVGMNQSAVEVWDVDTGRRLSNLVDDSAPARGVAFSPDGRSVASCYVGDTQIKIRDVATGRLERTLSGHTDRVWSMAFSPDCRRLVSSGQDQTIRVWDLANGQDLLTLRGHAGWIRSVVFSPDGHKIASASDDGRVFVWDASTPVLARQE